MVQLQRYKKSHSGHPQSCLFKGPGQKGTFSFHTPFCDLFLLPSINPRSHLLLHSNTKKMPQFSQAALCTYQIHLMQNINYHLDTRSNMFASIQRGSKYSTENRCPWIFFFFFFHFANPKAAVVSLDVTGLMGSESFLFVFYFSLGLQTCKTVQTVKLSCKPIQSLTSQAEVPPFPLVHI